MHAKYPGSNLVSGSEKRVIWPKVKWPK